MKRKVESLQILRGMAIFLIFLSHCDQLLLFDGENRLNNLGGFGVAVFISLSGFLTSYRGSGENTLKNPIDLYITKWKKFCWLHLFTLFLAIPFSFSLLKKSILQWMGCLFLNASLLQVWIPKASVYFSFNAVSWYLSLTLSFAVLTPFVIKLWENLDEKRVLKASVVVIVFEFVLCYLLQEKAFVHWAVYIFPITRLVDFVIGGGYYRIAKSLQDKERRGENFKWLLPCSILILLLLGTSSFFFVSEYYSTAIWTLPSCWVVTSTFLFNEKPRRLISKGFYHLGNMSFEFFMIHQLILRYLGVIVRRYGISIYIDYFLAFVISCLGAYILHNHDKVIGLIKNEQG